MQDNKNRELSVSSPGFEDQGLIPVQYTGNGADSSPELRLSGLNREAVSIAVIMNDMDHPVPAYNHWVIWNIPAISVIPGGIPHGERVEALNGAVQVVVVSFDADGCKVHRHSKRRVNTLQAYVPRHRLRCRSHLSVGAYW